MPAWPPAWIIEDVTSWGIMYGCDPTHFCPGEAFLRADMAVSLEFMVHGATFVPPEAEGLFADATGEYAEYACWAEALHDDEITAGCSKTPPLYCPGNNLTRAQMAIFLVKTRCLMVGDDGYCTPDFTALPACNPSNPPFSDVPCGSLGERHIAAITDLGITAGCGGGNFCPNRNITRAETAVFLIKTVESTGCATELTPPINIEN
jgi:hypothetical protein